MHKAICKKNVCLGNTEKVLFTEGDTYEIRPTQKFYFDGIITDDHGDRHTVDNRFINEYFTMV